MYIKLKKIEPGCLGSRSPPSQNLGVHSQYAHRVDDLRVNPVLWSQKTNSKNV